MASSLVLSLSNRLTFPNAHVAHPHKCSSGISKSYDRKHTCDYLPISQAPSPVFPLMLKHQSSSTPHYVSPLLIGQQALLNLFCSVSYICPFLFISPTLGEFLLHCSLGRHHSPNCCTSASFGCSESSLWCVGASLVMMCEF